MTKSTNASWMNGKKLHLKYPMLHMDKQLKRIRTMDLNAYFQILIGVLMTGTFITLALILLNIYFGKDEKESGEKD